jgi:hypothetical protein
MLWIWQILSQHRYMEDIVYSFHGIGQLQAISQTANSSYDHKRSNIPQTKLSSCAKAHNALCRRYFEKNLIAHHKLNVLPPHISIALLTALSCEHTLLYPLYLLSCLLNPSWTNQ